MVNDNGLELRALEMQAHLRMQLRAVAQRIVEAARVAAAMHLEAPPQLGSEPYGQRVAIGGAGADTPGVSEDSRLPKGPQRGESVMEDESPAPPPPASDYAYTRRPPRYSPAD